MSYGNSPNSYHFSLIRGARLFLVRARGVLRHPIFPILTIFGNGTIFVSALLLYALEAGHNPKLHTFLDALWWAVATAATVGYGDISPVTPAGKVLGICMMIFGTALFSSFTALFASVLVFPEFSQVEREMAGVGQAIREIEKEIATDEEKLQNILEKIELNIDDIRKIQGKKRPTTL